MAAPEYQIVKVGDINNIRFTGYIILACAVAIILAGIKYVSRVGSLFLMIVLFVILCMYVGCFIGPGDRAPADYSVALTGGGDMDLSWTGPSAASFSDNWGEAYTKPQLAFPSDTTEWNFMTMMG
ncbi:unnamed protein product, partial [Polarella glacialis]